MSPALATRSLSVALGGRPVLHGIDLSLPAARWTSVVGPNGAGKSTLLRAMAGLLPHGGEVSLLGRPLAAWSGRDRARRLAWLGQGETGADDLTVWDVAMLGRLPHQADWLDLTRREVAAGRTVVTVLHEIGMALHADEMVIVDQGVIRHRGPASDPATRAALEAVFHHRIRILQAGDQWVAVPC